MQSCLSRDELNAYTEIIYVVYEEQLCTRHSVYEMILSIDFGLIIAEFPRIFVMYSERKLNESLILKRSLEPQECNLLLKLPKVKRCLEQQECNSDPSKEPN